MFIGEMCCIFAYLFMYRKQRSEYGENLTDDEKAALQKGVSLRFSPLWFAIPACFDTMSTTLMYVGLSSIDASVMQIINCTILMWIAFFSIIYLKRRYTRQQYIGLAALVVGVAVVAAGAIMNRGESKSSNSPFGIICSVLSVVFGGMLMVSEEKLLTVFYAHPLQIVGTEGAAGLSMFAVLLVIFYFIPCTPSANFCSYGILEDTPRAIMEIGSSGLLFGMVLLAIASLGFFNYFGVSLTKSASATHRGAVNAVRPFTVWIFCLIVKWEVFTWMQLVGYLISVYGMLLYYGIIPLNPFAKKNKEVALTEEA